MRRASRNLWHLSLRVPATDEEAVRAELFARTALCPVVRQYPGRRHVWLEWYFAHRGRLEQVRRQIAPWRPVVRRLPYENWADSWKKHFPVQRIGRRLVIRPTWRTHRARRGEVVIEMEPGLSFGTGLHPTTRFCLKMIERLARPACGGLLDVGTGSGILAVAAAKLGYRPVLGVDCDPQAVRIARENLHRNLGSRPRWAAVRRVALERLPTSRQFALVVANLQTDLILAQRRRLAALVAAGGRLILAGILAKEVSLVRRAFRALGMQPFACERQGNWAGFGCRKQAR